MPKFTVVGLKPAEARLPTTPVMTPSRLIVWVGSAVMPKPLPIAVPLESSRICTLAVLVPVALVFSVTTMLVLSLPPASSPLMTPFVVKLAALAPPMLPKAAFSASEKPSAVAVLLIVKVRVWMLLASTLPKLIGPMALAWARR